MTKFRLPAIVAGSFLTLILAGCGETYRPVVIPFPGEPGNPQNQRIVAVANEGVSPSTGSACGANETCRGSVTTIDVPGDVNIGNMVVGESPMSIALIGVNAFTADSGTNTVTTFSPLFPNSPPTTFTIPQTITVDGASRTFSPINSISAVSGGVLAPMPATSASDNGVIAVVGSSGSGFSRALSVGRNPTFVAATPDSSRFYVLNSGDGTVTAFAITDFTKLATITVGSQPVYAVARPDSKFVFVLNRASGTVSVINTGTDTVATSASFGAITSALPNQPIGHPMAYDSKNTRIWVTNPDNNTVTVFNASQIDAETPALPVLATVQLPANSAPFAIAVLPDGSRAYVLCAGTSGVAPTIYSIDGSSFLQSKVTGFLGTGPRDIVSAGSTENNNTFKVYVINHDPTLAQDGSVVQQPGTNIISSVTNSFVMNGSKPLTIPAPFQDPQNCKNDGPTCPRQRPNAVVTQ